MPPHTTNQQTKPSVIQLLSELADDPFSVATASRKALGIRSPDETQPHNKESKVESALVS